MSMETFMDKYKKEIKINIAVVLIISIGFLFSAVGKNMNNMLVTSYTFTEFMIDLIFGCIFIGGFFYIFVIPFLTTLFNELYIIKECVNSKLNLYDFKRYLDDIKYEESESL